MLCCTYYYCGVLNNIMFPYSRVSSSSSDIELSDEATAKPHSDYYYCSLALPLSQVLFVDDEKGLKTCWEVIQQVSLMDWLHRLT